MYFIEGGSVVNDFEELTGDALWERILLEVEKSQERMEGLIVDLENGVVTFNNDVLKQEAFVHKSAKRGNTLQFTYFDEYGAVGDFEATSHEDLAKKIEDYGFQSCSKEDFKYTMLAESEQFMPSDTTVEDRKNRSWGNNKQSCLER